jgi:hypothetical protein
VKKNQQDKRLIEIQSAIASGETREDVAKRLGYKTWKGLDIYMRRKGMMWNSRQKVYYNPSDYDFGSLKTSRVPGEQPPKIAAIISMFGESGADPMQIALRNGFKDHREMASYMSARGYTWSFDENNYVKTYKNSNGKQDNKDSAKSESYMTGGESDKSDSANAAGSNGLSRYAPLLELILKNKDKFYEFLQSSSETIPRYVVPGISRTKSFYMSDKLSSLVAEFSTKFNISQKEIIETALIEFLKKYSFEEEVEHMLHSR